MNLYKKTIISVFTLLSALSFSQAEGTSEFNLSVGTSTHEDFRTAIENVASSLVSAVVAGDKLTHEDSSNSLAFIARYTYAIQDQWMLGVALAYQNVKGDLLLNEKSAGETSSKVYSLGIETDYRYISKPNFQMYSGLGLGYAFGKTTFDLGNKLELKDKNNSKPE